LIDWDQNNTADFVRRVAQNDAKHIFAFELGNELCNHVDPTVYANDILHLRDLVDQHWPGTAAKPLVNGPDCNPISGPWVDQFISNVSGGVLDVFTYHNYVGYGLDPLLAPKMMSSDWNFFNEGPKRAAAFIDGWKRLGAPGGMQLWAGEIAAAWHSGEPGVTNRFISSFWYADALGLLASLNHTGFCRQSLVGGNYGLLNRTTRQPNPDFYVAQLFHDLMGTGVLQISTGGALPKGLRSYAQCNDGTGTKGGDAGTGRATLLFINVSPSITFSLTMPLAMAWRGKEDATTSMADAVGALGRGSPGTKPAGLTLEVYELTAGDGSKEKWEGLDSSTIRLNGDLLDAAIAGPLPRPRKVALGKDRRFRVGPLSIVFVVLPEASIPACANAAL